MNSLNITTRYQGGEDLTIKVGYCRVGRRLHLSASPFKHHKVWVTAKHGSMPQSVWRWLALGYDPQSGALGELIELLLDLYGRSDVEHYDASGITQWGIDITIYHLRVAQQSLLASAGNNQA